MRADKREEHRAVRLRSQATLAAVCVSALLVVLKLWAWFATGSIALLGSLVDSLLDFLASVITLIAVRHSLVPPDHDHRFGHGKAEPLAGLGRGGFVLLSAAFVMYEAVNRLIAPEPMSHVGLGIGVLAVSIAMSGGLFLFQRYVYRQTGSLAVGADAMNYATDSLVSAGAIAVLILADGMGFALADPLFGFAIAIVIAASTLGIIRQSYDQLMDREFDDEDRERIKEIVLSHPEAEGIHDLRTRRSGRDRFIQFHLELQPDLSLREAHRIADEVEEMVERAFPGADVTAHQEPVGEFIENELVKT